MFNTLLKSTLAAMLICTTSASAQGKFLTAAQVKTTLNATKGSWIAVREYEGQDLLYFSHLLAWRCGLSGLLYTINDAEPMLNWNLTRAMRTARPRLQSLRIKPFIWLNR
ncbi:MAG: hypothetical protein QNK92_06555 [Amylibacter sp.]